ncbi:hypothetical protein AAKU55_001971 [Oxalobacteraceae bacterium GrIS 1.11]
MPKSSSAITTPPGCNRTGPQPSGRLARWNDSETRIFLAAKKKPLASGAPEGVAFLFKIEEFMEATAKSMKFYIFSLNAEEKGSFMSVEFRHFQIDAHTGAQNKNSGQLSGLQSGLIDIKNSIPARIRSDSDSIQYSSARHHSKK